MDRQRRYRDARLAVMRRLGTSTKLINGFIRDEEITEQVEQVSRRGWVISSLISGQAA